MELQEKTETVQMPETLDMVSLSADEQKKVEEIVKGINVQDSQFIMQYGVGAQNQIANFADNVLNEVRGKDSGYVGEVLTNLVVKVKDLDVNSLSSHPSGMLSKIPIIGSIMDNAQKFMVRYQKLSVEIETIVDEMDRSRMQLLKDVTLLDMLFEKNLQSLRQLDLYILAGTTKLKEVQDVVLPALQSEAEQSKDPVVGQRFNDMSQLVNRFDKKIHDLKLSRTIAIQTLPQIRLIQNNDRVLIDKIQSSILNTIPLWKNQVVIAITLFRQKKALEIQKSVTDTTNELLRKNSELLKESSIGIAKETERGIVDVETLKKVNADLISTIEETLKIQQEGRLKRQQAEQEIRQIESELKNKLAAVR